MIFLLIAGIAALLTGGLAIAIGVPVKEFSFGNTMILAGSMSACTGLILFGLWIATRELRAVARRIAMPAATGLAEPSLPELDAPPSRPAYPPRPAAPREPMIAPPVPIVPADERAEVEVAEPAMRPEPVPAPPPPPEPAPKPRRNLLFESSVRKDRTRTDSGVAPTIEAPQRTVFADPATTRERPDPVTTRERADRIRARAGQPTTYPDPQAAVQTEVTVIKSGDVDGMGYSLYSDGSIEAQMPEGMMRFASIEALRAHLDQRGA
jgi:hypothetical protein